MEVIDTPLSYYLYLFSFNRYFGLSDSIYGKEKAHRLNWELFKDMELYRKIPEF